MRQNMTHGYGQNVSTHGVQNTSRRIDYEIGVCYIEVPTVTLVRDPSRVPAGNGSRPDLSRVRSCCSGYIRNIHNFRICDPVCTQECVNALCTAPETCTCFPDHVKNLAGFCVPTCPIGCQNGHCSGGECLCKKGFKLDSESKFCIPSCKENCGGLGNCTDVNTCQCKDGYQSTSDGSCKPVCNRCNNGDCLGPNICRCKQGYGKDRQGICVPECSNGCEPNGICVSPNICEYPSTARPTVSPVPIYTPNQQKQPLYPGGELPRGDQVSSGERYPSNQNGTFSQELPRNPVYPGSQVNPGNQPQPGSPGYPGNQVQPGSNRYPGNEGRRPGYQGYPGNQVYPGPQPSPGNQVYPGVQPNPGNQIYPGSQPSPGNPIYPEQMYPGNQFHPGHQFYPSNQLYPGYQGYGNRGQYGHQGQFDVQSGLHREAESQEQIGHLENQFTEQLSVQCSESCLNGICVGNGLCQCNPGYVSDPIEPNRCVPNCPGGCPNGICSAPHFCICNVGYYKDTSVKGRSVCVKRIRRSADTREPLDLSKLLIFDIADY